MKKIITVFKKDVAEQIVDELGTSYMIQELNGQEAYSFVESDRLIKLLSDKRKFSKKDWFTDNKLRF